MDDTAPYYDKRLADMEGDEFDVEAMSGRVHMSDDRVYMDDDSADAVANLMFTPAGARELAQALNDAADAAEAQ